MNEQINVRMDTSELQTLTVGQWVASFPQSARVFENLGIDYCCGGKRTLEEVCDPKGLDAAALRAELVETLRDPTLAKGNDWGQASLGAIIDFIESTHHEYIRAEGPRLTALAQKVARVHGSRHPELIALATAVERIFQELDTHLEKEEKVFFPACRKWEISGQGKSLDPNLIDGLDGMETEHVEAGQILATIRELTSGFIPPDDACNSYLALFHGLEQFEADLHEHTHKENNILHARIVSGVGKPDLNPEVNPEVKSNKDGIQPESCCED